MTAENNTTPTIIIENHVFERPEQIRYLGESTIIDTNNTYYEIKQRSIAATRA